MDSLSSDTNESNMENAYLNMVETAGMFDISFPKSINTSDLEKILGDDSCTRKDKVKRIAIFLGINKKENPEAFEIVNLICGIEGNLRIICKDVFSDDNTVSKLSFSKGDYEENFAELIETIGDDYAELIKSAKEVHDIGLLTKILKGCSYLSVARVEEYDEHKNDLKMLKAVLKTYDKKAYNQLFRVMADGNYSTYVGSVNSNKFNKESIRRNDNKGRNQEDLYKTILKMLKELPKESENDPRVDEIKGRIDRGIFLPKQLTGKNGVIPNQVHAREMRKILDNASTYLPFLNEIDESGLSLKERILQVFTFHIPYYIGPLGQEHLDEEGYNVWAKRIEPGKIYPWNINQKIDVEGAAEKFIVRMLRSCTYLNDEKALPKQSLLYEKFMVLNELNALRIRGEGISADIKQDIYNDLFMKGRKVTQNKLKKYLISKGIVGENESFNEVISGIDGDFKSSLSSINKFAPIFGEDNVYGSSRDMIEQIIFWGTVFGNDRKVFFRKIEEEYGNQIDDKKIERITGLSFNGWGNLSKRLLEMPGATGSDDENKSIITSLWETNETLMELLGRQHTFREEIEKKALKAQKDLMEFEPEDLDDLYLSPSVKRMVWQTVKILKDIYAVKGYAPKRVFVEMPRKDGEKGKRTQSRKKKLEDLYKGQKELLSEIESHEEHDFRQKKLYLYYLQNGKSMYTGKPIDLENLLGGNSRYDFDHIYPRRYIKDDSIENNLVLVEKEINSGIKSGEYPLNMDIQSRMGAFWKDLLDEKFITKEKYMRLIRQTPFTESEKADFIARQLVETRQGTKAITQVLKQVFPECEVVFSKAGLVSDFRNKRDIPKVRCLNSCHHAHDAYLNIVVGNTYHTKFTSNPLNFVREANKNTSDVRYKYHMDKIFDYRVERNGQIAWIPQDEEGATIKTVKKMLNRNTVLITNKEYMQHGGLFDATIYNKRKAKADAYFPLKTSDDRLKDVTKYGGTTSISSAAYALIEYTLGGKTKDKDVCERALVRVPIYLGNIGNNDERLSAYLEDTVRQNNKKKVTDFSLRLYPIRFGAMVKLDGFVYTIGGTSENNIYLYDFVPLYICDAHQAYLKKIEKAVASGYYMEKDSNGEIIITGKKNEDIYELFLDKLRNSIYKNKKCSIANTLINGQPEFCELSIEKQCYVIMQIISWFNTAKSTVDLSDLKGAGGSTEAGKLRVSNKIHKCREVELINTSPTGLFQKRINLLKI